MTPPRSRRARRIRPYLTRSVRRHHPAPEPPADGHPVAPPPAAPPVSLDVLRRVRDALRSPETPPSHPGPHPPRAEATAALAADLAPLGHASRARHPHAWAPAAANEPPPDAITTAPLPILEVEP